MAKKTNPTAVGVFVLGAIALTVAGLVVIGGGALFRQRNYAVMYFDDAVSGLDVGAPLDFDGVRIGSVSSVKMQINRNTGETRIPVVVQIEQERFEATGELNDPEAQLEDLVKRGLRAQLANQSMLTGKLKITLAYKPDAPDSRKGFPSEHPEIPTIPTTLSQLEKKLQEIPIVETLNEIHRISKTLGDLLDNPLIEQTLTNLAQTVSHIDNLVTRIEKDYDEASDGVGAEVREVITSLDDALDSITELVNNASEGFSPLMGSVTGTVFQANALASSLKALTDETSSLLDKD